MIFQCRESIRDIIIYPHIKFWWYRTMLSFCGIVAAILKMETGRNFSMLGINSGCWICAVLWWPFWKWWPVEIFRCQESIRDIIIYPHMKCRWNQTMLNLCGIVVAILKMATGRNFSMSGHHYLPTYKILMISDNVDFLCRVLAAIFKMADISKILKMQNCSSNGDLSLCQILCLYHYPFRSYQH